MTAKLVLVGSDPPVEHALKSFNTLGSFADRSIVVNDPGVAWHHAHIFLAPGGRCVIRNFGGALHVNGQDITDKRVLRHGDEIRIGDTTFRLVISRPAGEPTPRLPPPPPPPALVVPRGAASVLVRRRDGDSYRDGVPRLEELGPLPMPAGAVHVLDLAADVLVFAGRGALTILRGLTTGPRVQQVVKVPGKPRIHALRMIDGVVFVGAETKNGMLGWVDLRAEPRWRAIALPPEALRWGKAVDGFAVHATCMIAVDDVVEPRYFLVLDVSQPRAPRFVELRIFDDHLLMSGVASVADDGHVMALLTHGFGRGHRFSSIELLELPTLEPRGWLSVARVGTAGREPRLFDFRAVAMVRDQIFIAAGADGVGVLRVLPGDDARLELDAVRFVPVAAGPVVDVIPVDESHVFAVVERERRGLAAMFRPPELDARLVSLAPPDVD